ncbi:hypothetical protein BGZ83_011122 [Gryganskiella cystojenkinii]|nr:hypothetical protein BGZ83_011122 [Gryganskiella cystojenkinii]
MKPSSPLLSLSNVLTLVSLVGILKTAQGLEFKVAEELKIGTESKIEWIGESSLGRVEQSVVLFKEDEPIITLCQGLISGSGQCSFTLTEKDVKTQDRGNYGYHLGLQGPDGLVLDVSKDFDILSDHLVTEQHRGDDGDEDEWEEEDEEEEEDQEAREEEEEEEDDREQRKKVEKEERRKKNEKEEKEEKEAARKEKEEKEAAKKEKEEKEAAKKEKEAAKKEKKEREAQKKKKQQHQHKKVMKDHRHEEEEENEDTDLDVNLDTLLSEQMAMRNDDHYHHPPRPSLVLTATVDAAAPASSPDEPVAPPTAASASGSGSDSKPTPLSDAHVVVTDPAVPVVASSMNAGETAATTLNPTLNPAPAAGAAVIVETTVSNPNNDAKHKAAEKEVQGDHAKKGEKDVKKANTQEKKTGEIKKDEKENKKVSDKGSESNKENQDKTSETTKETVDDAWAKVVTFAKSIGAVVSETLKRVTSRVTGDHHATDVNENQHQQQQEL